MRYFLCILCPPIAVLTTGRIGAFILSIFLTLCFWIPGIIHSILVVNRHYADKRHKEMIKAVKEKAA